MMTEHNTAPVHGARAATENPEIWVKVRRLARELSQALAECEGAQWMATIHPHQEGRRPILFSDISETAENRLEYHAKHYAIAARDIDPDARELGMGRAVGSEPNTRFYLSVSRQFATKATRA
ncbi:hypothetical protein [Aminobacter ciceronei]|uniref:Uncharacterized protein n=2 Tax=Aminobacter ciceronei TaxID=150723 RepID=A0ABR6CFX3_9HYPH|nr:hypothetical protein [Aminobacter ciceronei]MBA8910169.1 hypothetical protein [Aminobacter ciceronei]MBA9023941.1 hypothetical protein [Aminobacter ciceronei]